MSSLRRLLGYHKMNIKQSILQWFYINKLRTRIRVGKGCTISKGLIFGENVTIRNNVFIGKNVELGADVTIGSYAFINNITIGNNTHIEGGVKTTGCGKGKIIIGKESYIGSNNILDWSDNITIGNFVHIAGLSTGLWTHSSAKQANTGIPLNDKNPVYRPTAPIVIEDNVYIGGNCTIYPGVKIGKQSIIAPNSVVNKNVKSGMLAGGVPVKPIKKIE